LSSCITKHKIHKIESCTKNDIKNIHEVKK
jgi:hypothetical protein